jgi:hypothetical protein
VSTDYVELEALKGTLEASRVTFLNGDLEVAIPAASRGVDGVCNRRFWLDALGDDDEPPARVYTPDRHLTLDLDDVAELVAVEVARAGDGNFTQAWELGRDFVLEPANAPLDGRPYERLKLHPYGRYRLPVGLPQSVRVSGRFGWPAVPTEVVQATGIAAARLLRRARETPFPIASVAGEAGVSQRVIPMIRNDAELMFLLSDLIRETYLA